MKKILSVLINPKQRRQLITVASAVLILAGLAARHLFDTQQQGDPYFTAAAIIAGIEIGWRALQALRLRHLSIELLVSIATVGALIIGETWEAAAVTFLFSLGGWLEARTLDRTRKALARLLELAPSQAYVLRSDEVVQVPASQVLKGETVVIKPGGKVPVDGIVLQGSSALDESTITGESMPREKTRNDTVFAGTINLQGLLHVQAAKVGADTTLAKIIRRVEEAQEEKAPSQRFIERFAQWYTPAIFVMSIGVYLLTREIELALTLLVIACPGALVISTPVSVVAGIGRAAQKGILIKGGEYLENAGKVDAIAFDKTGTLTYGKPEIRDVIAFIPTAAIKPLPERPHMAPDPRSRWDESQLQVLHWAAVAESGSDHPLAEPIIQAAGLGSRQISLDEFDSIPGKGLCASQNGNRVMVGSPVWMESTQGKLPVDVQDTVRRHQEDGSTPILVAINGELLGLISLADTIRDDSEMLADELERIGIERVLMLTGDNQRTAKQIAADAGITEVYAGLLPEQKRTVIRELQDQGHTVAMIGDGVNDAPALATADIGVAMGAAGSDVAIETADIALMGDDLMKVPEAMRLSRATLRNIRQNTAIALLTVGLLLAGVLAGKVHMASGMLIHEISVFLVIINAIRLMRA